MNKTQKFIQKLSPKNRDKILQTAILISNNQINNLDYKKLKGSNNLYRVRVGKFRIIFLKDKNNNYQIKEITKRDNNTYKQ